MRLTNHPQNILSVTASPRGDRSVSRQLSSLFISQWVADWPADNVIERDVGRQPPALITEQWISAAFTPAAERSEEQNVVLSNSDRLINEVSKANLILIATPLHNYGMPAALKAWLTKSFALTKPLALT